MAKVHLYVHDLRSSGVVRNALLIAERLARDFETTLVAGANVGLFARAVRAGSYRFAALHDRAVSRLHAAPALARWLGEEPAVLLSCGNFGHPTAWLGTFAKPRIRRIYRMSNEIAGRGGPSDLVRDAWTRMLAHDAAAVAAVGERVGHDPALAAALAAGKARIIPNGIDLAHARACAAAPAPHPWLGADVPVVLAIGRLRPQKNFGFLIDAVAAARASRRMRLLIVGGGSARARAGLERTARTRGLGEDFALVGETDNVFAWLARASAFALPSLREGSSVALLEALVADVPVVAARQAGDAASVLAEGRYGLLADARDVGGFAAALLQQVSAQAVRPGERAQAYDLAGTLDAYADLVREVASA